MAEATASAPAGGGVKASKTILKTAARYVARISAGERIMRDASGRLQWASGNAVGLRTVEYMLQTDQLQQLDADLFGSRAHGQTLGVEHG